MIGQKDEGGQNRGSGGRRKSVERGGRQNSMGAKKNPSKNARRLRSTLRKRREAEPQPKNLNNSPEGLGEQAFCCQSLRNLTVIPRPFLKPWLFPMLWLIFFP